MSNQELLDELNREGRKVFDLREAAIAEIEAGGDEDTAYRAWNAAATVFGDKVREAGVSSQQLEGYAADATGEPIA